MEKNMSSGPDWQYHKMDPTEHRAAHTFAQRARMAAHQRTVRHMANRLKALTAGAPAVSGPVSVEP